MDDGPNATRRIMLIASLAGEPPGISPAYCSTAIVSVLLFSYLLAIALPRQRFFHALLLTRFQVERMAFDFLDDVFRLDFPFEATQGILKGFAFLNSNLCQKKYTSKQSQSGDLKHTLMLGADYTKFLHSAL